MSHSNRIRKVSAFMSVMLLLQLLIAAAVSAGSYDPDLKPSSNVLSGQDLLPAKLIDGFNTAAEVAEWKPGTNTDRVEFKTAILNGPNSPYEGSGVLEQVPQRVKVYEWRTIYREYAEPLDLSGYRYLAFAANSWGWQPVDYMMRITLYSGDDTYESVAKIEHDSWSRVFVRLGDWEGRRSVTRIEISFMQNFDLQGVAPGAPGYDYWDGRFQIDSLSATNVRDLTFDAEGDTEGFSSPSGSVEWSGGELVYALAGAAGVLESPELTLDTAKRNGLAVTMTNGTGASEMTVEWRTAGGEWNAGQAKTFAIPSSGTFTQDLNFSDRAEWSGTVTAFRFLVPATEGTLRIDQIRPKLLPALEKPYDGTAQARLTEAGSIAITGTVKPAFVTANPGAGLYLFELATYEDAKTVLSSKEPLASAALAESFFFETGLNDGDRSRLYSKFAVAAKSEGGEYALVAAPQYVVNPEAISGNSEPFPTAKSIKGLQVQMTGDAQELGISHAALNVAYNELTYKTNGNPANTIPYAVEGKTYYLRKDRIEALDRQVKNLSDNGIIVSLILIMYDTKDANSANEYLLHPDSRPGGTVYALNTSNAVGVEYVKATTKFLAERYSLPSQEHGRAVNYIVGNEIGQNMVWNNMGPKKMEDYVREYAQTLRLIDTIVKTAYANARTYVSLDHFWDENLGGDSLWKYDNKAIVDRLNELTKAEGGFDWNLAFHPYPEDLFDPRFWNDETATESFHTKRITFKNLDVLVDYMKQPDYLYDGEMRRIILSEQGFHSLSNSEEDQKVQAAAYAYAYYKVRFLDGIDAFILHRHVDHGQEGGLNLGLWTHANGTVVTPGEHKAIYDVFKYIDTERSLEATAFAKAIIGIGDWADAIPGFDPARLADRSLPETKGLDFVVRDKGTGTDGGFESGGAEGFAASDEVSAVAAATGDAFEGTGYLSAAVNSAYGLNWAGVQKTFATPVDAKKTPFFTAAIQVPNANPKLAYYAKFIAYSGNESAEGTAKLDPSAGWQQLALPLKGWEGAGSIDRVKIWVRSEGGSPWKGELRIDEATFAKDAKSDKKLPNVEASAKLLSEELEAGSQIRLTVTNHGSSKLNKDLTLQTEGGVSVMPESVKLDHLETGESQTLTIEVTGFAPQEDADAVLKAKYEGREFSFVLKAKPVPVSLPFTFEEGDTQGWKAGDNTASVASVSSFANGPTKPSQGQYALAAHSQAVAANAWRTVKLDLAKPLDLSAAGKLAYDIDSYGGVPGATYETRLTLKSGAESFVSSSAMSPDRWNQIAADISGWALRSSVTSIEISFRAAGSTMAWAPDFQVDHIRLAN